MILLIDNYDSFVHNLARYFRLLSVETTVYRNDAVSVEAIEDLGPAAIVLSPGPCTPDEAGVSLDVVRYFAGQVPMLGVCLGHQAIIQAYGGKIVRANEAIHGTASPIFHDGNGEFESIPQPFLAGRYHSLIACREGLPGELIPSAWLSDGTVMGVRWRQPDLRAPLIGWQFHPESILTPCGLDLIRAFLRLADRPSSTTRDFSEELIPRPASSIPTFSPPMNF